MVATFLHCSDFNVLLMNYFDVATSIIRREFNFLLCDPFDVCNFNHTSRLRFFVRLLQKLLFGRDLPLTLLGSDVATAR